MNSQNIPAPQTCQDQLALNYGEPEPCNYAGVDPEAPDPEIMDGDGAFQPGGCSSCGGGSGNGTTNGSGNGSAGFLGMPKSKWLWIILAAIVGYYLWKKNK